MGGRGASSGISKAGKQNGWMKKIGEGRTEKGADE